MPDGIADSLINKVDSDGDRVLTFTELAWVVATDETAFEAILKDKD